MNLTLKRLLQFMTVSAGACALTATATTWVGDSFEAPAGTNGNPIGWYKMSVSGDLHTTNSVWISSGLDVGSKLVPGDTNNTGYAAASRPMSDGTVLVLNLETEGTTLSRVVTNDVNPTCSFASGSVYVDTLIRFTPSEDTPTISNDVKVAVFVDAASNLVVHHMAEGVPFFVTNSIFSGLAKINPTNWYRLTIRMGGGPALGRPLCQIRLDGALLSGPLGYTDDGDPNGPWFATISTDTSLSAVAFQGTGGVDELLVTTDTPTYVTGAGVKLTLMFNDNEVFVTTNGFAAAEGAEVPNNTPIVISALPWYEISGFGALFTGGDTTNKVAGTSMITNINGSVSDVNGLTNTIAAVPYTYTGSSSATGLGGSYPVNKVAAWALANGLTTLTSDMADDYLLGVAPTTDAGLKISNIVYDGSKASITVVATTNAVNFQAINGTIVVRTSTDLVNEGFAQPTLFSVVVTNIAGVVIDVPNASGNFIKARIQ